MPKTFFRSAARLALLQLSLVACAAPSAPPAQTAAAHSGAAIASSARPWDAGSAIFRSGGAWLGADSAYSIPLDASHVLWLYADTFIDPSLDGTRENGPNFFIRNSIGIQTGPTPEAAHDLSQSTMSFHWGPTKDKAPTSFFHDVDGGEHWVWPFHGARLPGGELLIFRMQVVKDTGGFGFRVDSWDAIAIDDPSQPPDSWQPRVIAAPTKTFDKLLGSSVLVHDGQLYAYAVDNANGSHAISLARWSLAQLAGLANGALNDPEWWTGQAFTRQSALPPGAAPAALFADGQVELSVHYEPERQRFVEVQMAGLFVADPKTQLAQRTAAKPEGPWSALEPFFRPAESALPNAADLGAYAAKVHPEQRGADWVVSYVVNDLKKFPPADKVYYPQMLQVGGR